MKTRQISLLIVLVITSFQLLWSQNPTGVVNNGARIVITSGASLKITGGAAADYTNLTNTTHGRIDLDGKIYLEGDWTNNAASGTVFINTDMDGEVLFIGSSGQSVGGTSSTSFEKLTLNNSSGLSLGADISLMGNLGLTNGSITLGAYDMTLGASSTIIGTPSSSKMIITSGSGVLKKGFTAAGSFIFPVGENTGTLEYSPATLNFTSGTFGGSAWASVNVTDLKHPNNASAANYLSRYWTVDQSNISNFSCNVTFNYLEADVNGTESSIYGGQWTDPNWIKLNNVSTSSNLVTGAVGHFSDFSGGESGEFSISMSMSDDGIITEAAEGGEVITVNLKNDEFVASLTPANWTLSNLPAGVTAGAPVRVNSTTATITLSGNRTVDFDSDITNISLLVKAAELTLSGSDLPASSSVTITSNQDSETLSISSGTITEGSEDAEEINVSLGGGTFAASLDKTNWMLSNLPSGVSIGSVSRTNATQAVITLSGDRDTDYDADITTIGLTISDDEFDESDAASLASGDYVTFVATDETAAITSPALNEINLDAADIVLDLTNETFADGTLLDVNFTLNNVPPGTTIEGITYNDVNTATIALAFNGTDFDSDFENFSITVDAAELDGVGDVTSDALTITAVLESAEVYLHHAGLTESNLNGAIIGVGLRQEIFLNDVLELAYFSIVNAPEGTTLTAVEYLGSTLDSARITLGFDGTDFDAVFDNFYLNIAADELSGTSGIASYSISITATDDPENIAIADDGEIIEGQESGQVITVTLTGGTFIDPLAPSKWALTNLPSGVTKGAVSRTSATEATVTLSGNRTTDYDSDITNMQLTVSSSEINDMTSGSLVAATGVTLKANHEALTIGHAGLTESNLNGAIVGLKLTEESFADGILDAGNFTLSGAPLGVTVGSVDWVAADTADLTLAFDLTDFDVNYDAFNITVGAAELAGLTGLTSGNLTITPVDEPGVVTISHTGLTESNLDGATIGISLDQETFADGALISGNFILNNVPPGVTVDDVIYSDPTTASLLLAFDGTDFDSDYGSFDITIAGSELTKNTEITSTTLSITADPDPESITMADDGSIIEGSESGEVITVTLTGGTFADPLTPANWSLTGLPNGVNKGAITRISNTSVTIALDGNRSVDYDLDITDVSLSVTEDEVNEYSGADLQTTGITFTALVESAAINHTGLEESNLNGAGIYLVLTNDEFVDGVISPLNIVLNNAPTGVSVSSVDYTSATEATVNLSFNGMDFDTDVTDFSITVQSAELAGEGSITSNSLTITAVAEPEAVSISHSGLTESNLNGAVVNMTLANVVFADAVLDVGNFTLNNSPAGVTLSGVTYVSATSATLTIVFDGTDFDADVTTFNVTVLPAELTPAVNITSNNLTITAVVEAAGLTISDPGLTEENLDGNTLILTLDQVEFADGTILRDKVVLNNAPAGVTVSSVTWNTATTATVTLAYNGMDFDSDILNFSVTVLSAEITGGSDVSSNLISISATVEPTSIFITPSVALTEGNMDGAVITMSLTEVAFADATLDPANFVLNNAPTGLTVGSVNYVNDTAATITLAYVRTDFDSDILNFSITVSVNELSSGTDLTSNELTITAVIENEQLNITHAGLTELNLNGAIISMDLVQVMFSDAVLDAGNFTLNNAPGGLTIAVVTWVSTTSATMELDFVRGDFDADILNFSITVDVSELSEGSGLTSNDLTITAVVENEQVAISHSGLTADNLDQALINMKLTNVSFADSDLDEINFLLNGAPPGTSVDSAYAVDDSSAVIRLAYDNTPFAVVQNMSITVQSIELSGLDNLTSNSLTVGLTGIDPGAGVMNLEVYAYGNRIFIRSDMPGKLKEATLYNILGQEVANHKLEAMPLNEIVVDNVSNTYIIRVHTTEGTHTARVYVHVR